MNLRRRALMGGVPKYTFSVSGGTGIASISGTQSGVYPAGTVITLAATVSSGYVFSGWVVNGVTVSTGTDYSFTLTADTVVSAVASLPQYTLTLYANTGIASISGTQSGTYPAGTVITLAATVSSGYVFSGWVINGVTVSTSASYSFTLTENTVVSAVANAISQSWLIPVMTSNTAPSGVCSAASYNTWGGSQLWRAYYAFDGDDTTKGDVYYGYDYAMSGKIIYQFPQNVVISAVRLKGYVEGGGTLLAGGGLLEGSLDGSTWFSLVTFGPDQFNDTSVTTTYFSGREVKYIRVGATSTSNGHGIIFRTINAYGYTA